MAAPKIFLFFLLCFFATPSWADSEAHYYAPPSQVNASLTIMDQGFANVMGLFQNATGGFSYDDTTKTLKALRFALDASSLMANTPQNQNDLSQLLATFDYPEIQIITTEPTVFTDGKADMKGTLTLHGQSKPVTLAATLNRFGKSPRAGGLWEHEGDAVGLSLRTTIKRADFGMSDSTENPSRFGDALTLQLEMQAIRQ